jgi:hypothetical protein
VEVEERIPISNVLLVYPEVRSAVAAFVGRAPEVSPGTRSALLHVMGEMGTHPSKDPNTGVQRM